MMMNDTLYELGSYKTVEQVNTFSYLGYYLSCEEEKDLNMKTTNFLKITGIINQT
jgi:hypothetical protein